MYNLQQNHEDKTTNSRKQKQMLEKRKNHQPATITDTNYYCWQQLRPEVHVV